MRSLEQIVVCMSVLCLSYLGSDTPRVINAHFGVDLRTIAELQLHIDVYVTWQRLVEQPDEDILVTLHFLRCYPTRDASHQLWMIGETVHRAVIWRTIFRLRAALPAVRVSFCPCVWIVMSRLTHCS